MPPPASKLGSTLLLTVVALIIGIVAGLIVLRSRFEAAPPSAPTSIGDAETGKPAP
ncbi:MAG: hypothetical protein ABW061_21495 [Polyangiaceae bacterium]